MSTEWTQLQVIELLNDGSGLGFGIIGGKSTGVVVKTILPGGVADRVSTLVSRLKKLTTNFLLTFFFSRKKSHLFCKWL